MVLEQEIERFNRLTKRVLLTLKELQKAIKGVVVMTGELEQMYTDFLNNKVPGLWEKVAYPSLKPLGGWMRRLPQARRLHARLAHEPASPRLVLARPAFSSPRGS